MTRVLNKVKERCQLSGIFLALLVLTMLPAYAQTLGKPETIKLQATDYKTELIGRRDARGNVLVPLQDGRTGAFLEHYKCRPTYLVPMETIVLGLPGGNDLRIKIGEKQLTQGNRVIPLKAAAVLAGDEPYIPLDTIERACGLKSVYDKDARIYYLDTLITGVSLDTVNGNLTLKITAAHPVQYTTSKLEDPERFVIDINGAILDEGIADKDIHDAKVGDLFVSQESFNPNKVRVVVPMDKGITVAMTPAKPDQTEIQAIIQPKADSAAGIYGTERVSDLRLLEDKDKILLKVLTTGPVKFEWRRLLSPDNRYFVDISNCLYTAPPYHKDFDVGYLKSISVQQLRPTPDPVVRVTLELHVPSKVIVGPDEKYPGELHITVLSETINPVGADRQGFGISEVVPGQPTKMLTEGGTICIDPGHGGGDPGACYGGLAEKEVNLDIAFRLARLLRRAGWNVVMTRTTDRDVTYAGSPDGEELAARVAVAVKANAQLFVSIHNNASASGGGQGTAVYYNKPDSSLLAQHVNRHLIQANGRYNEGVLPGSFHVIRCTPMPAVLVECAYLSNPTELRLLGSAEFRQKCAEGIFNGLVSYARSRGLKGTREIIIEPEETPEEALQRKKLKALEEELKKNGPEGSGEYRER